MANEELKPCPFCGAPAEFKEGSKGVISIAYVECKSCEARSSAIEASVNYCAKNITIKLWNKRADDKV